MGIYNIENVWPEWKIEKELGRGAYGVVYKAVRNDYDLKTYAAIKVISIPSSASEIDTIRSEGFGVSETRTYFNEIVKDFVREIRLLETMRGIQNIVSIEDYKVVERQDELGWDIFIRMELLTPLNNFLCDKKLSEEDVINLGCDICTALETCAKRNIIHRDIKPENVFINDFGDYKLGDFGVARTLENMSYGFSQKGTYNYMAPEIAMGKEYDATVDLYSLGIMLYRLLNDNCLPFIDAGKQLLSPNERKLATERRLRGDQLPPPNNASAEMAHVILRACAFYPHDRFKSASEMKKALLYVKNGTYIIPADKTLDGPNTMPVKNEQKPRKYAAALIAVPIAGAVLALLLALGGPIVKHFSDGGIYTEDTADTDEIGDSEAEESTEETESQSETESIETESETETESIETETPSDSDASEIDVPDETETEPATQETESKANEPDTEKEPEVTEKTESEIETWEQDELYPMEEVMGMTRSAFGAYNFGADRSAGKNKNGEDVIGSFFVTLVDINAEDYIKSIIVSWENKNLYHNDSYTWEDQKNGQTWFNYCYDSDNMRSGIEIHIPDKPELAGRQWIRVNYADQSELFMFSLKCDGDYTNGRGWIIEGWEEGVVPYSQHSEICLKVKDNVTTLDNDPLNDMVLLSSGTFCAIDSLNNTTCTNKYGEYIDTVLRVEILNGEFLNRIKKVTTSWTGETAYSGERYTWEDQKNGITWYSKYRDTIDNTTNIDLYLPDKPEIEGRQWIKIEIDDKIMTVQFILKYLGDYTTGLGWDVSNVSYSVEESTQG